MSDLDRRVFLQQAAALAGASVLGGVWNPRLALATIRDPEVAGYAAVKGGRIWYRMNGCHHFSAGKVPVLVIHGGPGMSHHYLLPLAGLADERPVILYDQLDCGNSERPGDRANWTVERFVSEIDRLRDALGLERLFVLGNSWGGTVAAEYAMRQPKGLVGLVLASPLISTARWIADNTAYRHQLPPEVQKVLDRHEAAGTIDSQEYQDAVMVFYKRHLTRMEPWPEEMNKTFEVFSVSLYNYMWGNTEFNCSGTLKDYDSTSRLKQIQVPTFYTCGEFDECTPAASRFFSSLTPGSQVTVIPNASHTAFLEKPEEYRATVKAFFSRVETST